MNCGTILRIRRRTNGAVSSLWGRLGNRIRVEISCRSRVSESDERLLVRCCVRMLSRPFWRSCARCRAKPRSDRWVALREWAFDVAGIGVGCRHYTAMGIACGVLVESEDHWRLDFAMTAHTDEISAELPCHVCGYDLRAHPAEGKCPECGSSVAEARRVAGIPRRPLWRESDARWRRRVLLGVWLWVLLPLVEFLKAFEWTSGIRVPAVFQVGGYARRLDETFLATLRIFPLLIFCMGAGLIFSKERGRRRGRLDWTRRWGVFGSYLVLLLGAAQSLFISALVLAGVASLFLSMPPKFQPGVTGLFINMSAAWLRYGFYPKEASYIVFVVFSAIVVLLACVALFDALRSCGSKRMAAILLAPLVFFALMHLWEVARYCLGSSAAEDRDLYWLAIYFQPEILANKIAGAPVWGLQGTSRGDVLAEEAKWCVVFGIAIWLTIAQVLTWRRGKKARAAVSENIANEARRAVWSVAAPRLLVRFAAFPWLAP